MQRNRELNPLNEQFYVAWKKGAAMPTGVTMDVDTIKSVVKAVDEENDGCIKELFYVHESKYGNVPPLKVLEVAEAVRIKLVEDHGASSERQRE